jgi:hypothetical protein
MTELLREQVYQQQVANELEEEETAPLLLKLLHVPTSAKLLLKLLHVPTSA